MCNCVFDVIDQLYGDDFVQKFLFEIIWLCWDGVCDLCQIVFGVDFDFGFQQVLYQNWVVFGQKIVVDQQIFCCVVDFCVLGFGVQYYVVCFVQIGIVIGIDVVDVFKMGKDWDVGFGLYQFDQFFVVVWYDYVDQFLCVQYGVYCFMCVGGDYLDGGGGQICLCYVLYQCCMDCFG